MSSGIMYLRYIGTTSLIHMALEFCYESTKVKIFCNFLFFFFSTFSFCFFLLWNWPSDKIFRTLNHLLLLFHLAKSPIAKPRASTCRILKKKKKIVPFFYYLSNPTFIASSLYMHCSHRGLFTVSVFTPTNANASW